MSVQDTRSEHEINVEELLLGIDHSLEEIAKQLKIIANKL